MLTDDDLATIEQGARMAHNAPMRVLCEELRASRVRVGELEATCQQLAEALRKTWTEYHLWMHHTAERTIFCDAGDCSEIRTALAAAALDTPQAQTARESLQTRSARD